MRASTVQPSPTASWEPDIPVKGDPSAVFMWAGVILLVLAITLIFISAMVQDISSYPWAKGDSDVRS